MTLLYIRLSDSLWNSGDADRKSDRVLIENPNEWTRWFRWKREIPFQSRCGRMLTKTHCSYYLERRFLL